MVFGANLIMRTASRLVLAAASGSGLASPSSSRRLELEAFYFGGDVVGREVGVNAGHLEVAVAE